MGTPRRRSSRHLSNYSSRRLSQAIASIEPLETRRMMSVSLSSLLPSLSAGKVYAYQISNSSGGVLGNENINIVGNTTFNSFPCIEQDIVFSANGNTFTDRSYHAVTSQGYVNYGSYDTTTNASGGVLYSTEETYSPAQVSFPSEISQQTPYTTTTTLTDTSKNNVESTPTTSTSTSTRTETLTLESETTQPLTVPAGAYQVYKVDVSDTDTPQGGTATTDTSTEYLSDHSAPVELVGTGGDIVELTNDPGLGTGGTGGGGSGGGGGGGSGGSGGTTTTGNLTPAIIKNTIPTNVVAGGTSHGAVTVSLTNSGAAKITESVTTSVYATLDGVIDSSSILIGSITKTVPVKAGLATPVTIIVRSLPSTLSGDYTLLAKAVDTAGTTTSTTGPALNATAANVTFSNEVLKTNLAGNLVSGTKTRDTVKLTLTNTGNIASTGASTVELLLSPDGTVASGTEIRSLNESIILRPNKTKTVAIPLGTLPAVQTGTYQIVAEITDPRSDITSVATASTVSLAPPTLTLVPTLSAITPGAKGTGSVTLTITNNGNIPPSGKTTIALYPAASVSVHGAFLISESINLPIQPGKSKSIKFKLSSDDLTQLTAAGLLLVIVTDPLGGVQTATTTG
jgi:hypothetical protein